MRRLVLLAAAVVLGLAGCGGSGSTSDSPQQTDVPQQSASGESGTAGPTTESTSPSAEGKRDVVDDPPDKGWSDALAAARKEFTGDVSKIELEPRDSGGLEYKIELMSRDTKYAVQYDADTLEKLSEKKDDLGSDAAKKRKETFDPDDMIGLDEAVGTARDQQAGTVTSWKLEGKDTGRVQYEFDILPDGASDDVEVQIDATDGGVIQD